MSQREQLPEHAGSFVVAHNPEPDSTLSYLIRWPLPDGPLVLKAADIWPRTTEIYGHRAEGRPQSPRIIETVPVRACRR